MGYFSGGGGGVSLPKVSTGGGGGGLPSLPSLSSGGGGLPSLKNFANGSLSSVPGIGNGGLPSLQNLGNPLQQKLGQPAGVEGEAPTTGPLATDPNTGLPDLSYFFDKKGPAGLDKKYTLGDNKYNTGQGFIDQLAKRATATGDSPWLKLQNRKIDMETSGLRDQASLDANSSLGMGMSNLAASGGLDSGARERLASSACASRMNALQNASRLGSMGKINAGMEDERQKLAILQNLPGMQMQQGQFKAGLDQFDINNAMGLGKTAYTEGLKYKMGQEMADATSGGSSPYLTQVWQHWRETLSKPFRNTLFGGEGS